MSAVGPAVPQQPNNGGLNQTVVACFAFSFGVHCVFFFFFICALFANILCLDWTAPREMSLFYDAGLGSSDALYGE